MKTAYYEEFTYRRDLKIGLSVVTETSSINFEKKIRNKSKDKPAVADDVSEVTGRLWNLGVLCIASACIVDCRSTSPREALRAERGPLST
jgi:hypothetical protein